MAVYQVLFAEAALSCAEPGPKGGRQLGVTAVKQSALRCAKVLPKSLLHQQVPEVASIGQASLLLWPAVSLVQVASLCSSLAARGSKQDKALAGCGPQKRLHIAKAIPHFISSPDLFLLLWLRTSNGSAPVCWEET